MKTFKIIIVCFIVSIATSYKTIDFLSNSSKGKTDVLSYSVVAEVSKISPSPILTPTQTPTLTPTLFPTSVPAKIPSPTPTPRLPVQAPQDLEHWFDEFSNLFKVDEEKLKRIANCESHFNPGVVREPYAGMFQFTQSSWIKYRKMMGKNEDTDLRFGAREAIETAAYALSLGDEHIWPACSK